MDTLRTGARTPFFATDITHYHDLTAGDFDPIGDTPDTLSDTQEDVFIHNGFLVKNATDDAGLVYVVTWNEFEVHRTQSNMSLVTYFQVLALCTPIAVYLPSGGWCETPVVKVYATSDQTYPSTVEIINIGTIR